MKDQFADEPFEIETPEAARDFIMSLPLKTWPKIPRAYAVTRYDCLAEHLVQGCTVCHVSEIDCHVVTSVFGLELESENGTTRWLGRRMLVFEDSHPATALRLLRKMWRTHGLLRLSSESADYRNKLALAVQDLEEAFIDRASCREQAVAEAQDLLEQCPAIPPRPHQMRVPRIDLPPIILKGVTALQRPPRWPKGF